MTTANPGDPLGYDVDIDTDIQADGRAASGVRLVQNAILHRLMADTLPQIGAPGGVLAYGANVRLWVGEASTTTSLDAKGPLLTMVIGRDPRIDSGSISVSITVAPAGTTFASGAMVNLTIAISCRTTTALPIAMVVGVNALTVDLLAQGT